MWCKIQIETIPRRGVKRLMVRLLSWPSLLLRGWCNCLLTRTAQRTELWKMLAWLVNCSSDRPGSCPNASDKPLCRLALVTSKLKPSLFLTLEIGNLAPFIEILALLWNSCSLRFQTCWKWYAWIWSIFSTFSISRPVRGIRFTTPCRSFCNHVLYSSTYPASYLFFNHRPLHVDTSSPLLEDDLSERYFSVLVVIDNKRASISLDGYDLCPTKLSHHSSRVVGSHSSNARKD